MTLFAISIEGGEFLHSTRAELKGPQRLAVCGHDGKRRLIATLHPWWLALHCFSFSIWLIGSREHIYSR